MIATFHNCMHFLNRFVSIILQLKNRDHDHQVAGVAGKTQANGGMNKVRQPEFFIDLEKPDATYRPVTLPVCLGSTYLVSVLAIFKPVTCHRCVHQECVTRVPAAQLLETRELAAQPPPARSTAWESLTKLFV